MEALISEVCVDMAINRVCLIRQATICAETSFTCQWVTIMRNGHFILPHVHTLTGERYKPILGPYYLHRTIETAPFTSAERRLFDGSSPRLSGNIKR